MCDEYLQLTIDIDLLEVYIFGSTLGWQPNVFDEKTRFSPLLLAAAPGFLDSGSHGASDN